MTVENKYETLTVVASQDLTGHLFMAVGLDGLVAATTAAAAGLARTKALTGDHMTLAYKGIMKGKVGAAVNSGSRLGVTTSGYLITVTGSAYVGIARESVGSGSLVPFVGDFNMGQIA